MVRFAEVDSGGGEAAGAAPDMSGMPGQNE